MYEIIANNSSNKQVIENIITAIKENQELFFMDKIENFFYVVPVLKDVLIVSAAIHENLSKDLISKYPWDPIDLW